MEKAKHHIYTHMRMDENKLNLRELNPLVRVGKKGLTKEVIDEINVHLKKRGLIKIKMLRSAIDATTRKEIADEIEKSINCKVVSITGNMIILAKN